MTAHQKRVERTAADVARYLARYWRDKRTAAQVFAAYHLKHGGRAPGEKHKCATCGYFHCDGKCIYVDGCRNWQPKKGGAR